MRKWLLLVVFTINGFIITSCRNNPHLLKDYLGYTKADLLVDITHQYPVLKLKIYTGSSCNKIEIVDQDYIQQTTFNRYQIILLANGKAYDGYLYEFTINFKIVELDLDKLELLVNNQFRSLPFGTFKTIIIDENASYIACNTKMIDNNFILEVENSNLHNYYLTNIAKTYNMLSHQLVLNQQPTVIYKNQIQTITIGTFNIEEKYHQISGIYRITLQANLEDEIINVSYYLENNPCINQLKTTGIDITQLYTWQNK